jgi:hypothetical protein
LLKTEETIMFDMHYRTADGRVVKGGMAFDAADHPRVLMTRSGSALTARDWAKLKPKARRALAGDEELGPKHDLVRKKNMAERGESFDEGDVEHRLAIVRDYLRSKGLDEESIEAAIEHARRDLAGRVEGDALPVAGKEHALAPRSAGTLVKKMRAPGEQVFDPSASDSASFLRKYPDAARIGFSYGSSQFDPPPPRVTRLAADAADPSARPKKRLRKLFPDLDRIGVGPFPKRF